ncbi:putative MccF-like protein (microcin C7 resistance) [Belliella baltica DSM 15883]|uniref:Putative MccF-like protein (Microcin C7 resistance) n=1 Tax=Belliella baltica (strain DSM 15883 / CIP 108006 / LMG 21964 / BA134) TaxID=866536 RepID=I3Z6J4_BELBD|nr:LD-carboxypeptidase [Belliella baltica]AFL84862.1 putative MccF-like protein (microcin C7 resistance) [Belliella baltica DSM 15883]
MNKRNFIKSLGLTLGAVPFLAFDPLKEERKNLNSLLPQPLNEGDTVGLISPSSATAERIQFLFAQEVLEALGFKVKLGENLKNRRGHLAGTDEERASDLNSMFADSEVKAIICIRGGSGAARILPLIDYELIKKNPKPLLGYSDITALHNAIHAKTGLITFHGPNGTGSWNDFNVRQFKNIFFDKSQAVFQNETQKGDDLVIKNNRTITLNSGTAEGKILGGNLTVLTALSGTPYLPDFKDAILFLEDIGEDPYKIDRMMSTLKLNGTLDQIKGFVFGQCTDCTPSGGYGSLTLDDVLDDYILPLGIPAYKGAMIGHIPKQFIIPVGAKVKLDADACTLTMLEQIFQ